MKPKNRFWIALAVCSAVLLTPSVSMPYSGYSILQRVYMKCLLSENWVADWIGRNPTIKEIARSGNGEKIAFTVEMSDPWEKRLYTMNGDGTGLTDITGALPGAVDNALKVQRLQYDATGSRLFYVWNWLTDLYYCEGGSSHLVIDGITNADTNKPFAIDDSGQKLFFRDARWNEQQQKTLRGLFAVTAGGSPQLIVDIDELPCDDDPPPSSWYSRLKLLDCSGDGNILFFRWVTGISSLGKQTMFKFEAGGSPQPYPDEEHDQIWTSAYGLRNKITNTTGATVLYAYRDTGQPWTLSLVSSSGNHTIARTNDSNGFAFVSMDRSQTDWVRFYARFGFRHTLDAPFDFKRDTWSAHIPGSDPFSGEFLATDIHVLTDFWDTPVSYFAATREGGETDRIYSVTVKKQADISWSFGIVDIYYDRLPLYVDDSMPLKLFAKIHHSGGLGEIYWVKMHALTAGREYFDWKLDYPDFNNTAPIHYDPGLNDDGDFGDEEAGDGIFTNNTIRVRPDSGFYSEYGFPCYPGSRVVMRDMESNYFIADTWLKVDERSVCTGDLNGDRDVDGGDLFEFMSETNGMTLDEFAQDFGRTNCL
jgi:hypothetical protein